MKNVGVSQSTNNAILSRFSCLQIYWSVWLVACTHAGLAAEIFLLGCSKDCGSSGLQFQANSLSTAMCDTVHLSYSTTVCLSILHMGDSHPASWLWRSGRRQVGFQFFSIGLTSVLGTLLIVLQFWPLPQFLLLVMRGFNLFFLSSYFNMHNILLFV